MNRKSTNFGIRRQLSRVWSTHLQPGSRNNIKWVGFTPSYIINCDVHTNNYMLPPCSWVWFLPVSGLISSVQGARSHLSQVQLVDTGRVGPRRGRDPAVIWAFSNIFCQIVIDSMSQKYPLALQTLNISLENNYKMKITLHIMSTIQFFAVIFVHPWDGCQSGGSSCSSL